MSNTPYPGYSIEITRPQSDRARWKLFHNKDSVGYGALTFLEEFGLPREWGAVDAHIAKDHSGRGLYSKFVIPHLRRELGPIHSDPLRSDASERAWKKVQGAKKHTAKKARGGYVWRLNPGPAIKKTFVIRSFLGPVYRIGGKSLRRHSPTANDGVGGYHRRAGYPFIPGNQIWIEKMADGVTEERILLAHEMMEILVMRVLKWGYQKAHNAISRFEWRLRRDECPEKVFRAYIAKFFPKATPRAAKTALAGLMKTYRGYK